MPYLSNDRVELIEDLLKSGLTPQEVVKRAKSCLNTVYRIKQDMGDFTPRCSVCFLSLPHEDCLKPIEFYATNRRER